VKLLRLAIVVMFAAAAFVVTVSVVAANARPEPPPCNDTFIVDTPAHGSGDRDAIASCAAPEAPAWLVLGAGSVAAAGVIVGYSLVARRPRGAAKELAQQRS